MICVCVWWFLWNFNHWTNMSISRIKLSSPYVVSSCISLLILSLQSPVRFFFYLYELRAQFLITESIRSSLCVHNSLFNRHKYNKYMCVQSETNLSCVLVKLSLAWAPSKPISMLLSYLKLVNAINWKERSSSSTHSHIVPSHICFCSFVFKPPTCEMHQNHIFVLIYCRNFDVIHVTYITSPWLRFAKNENNMHKIHTNWFQSRQT